MSRADEFLNSFAQIERRLRQMTGRTRESSFSALVAQARKESPLVSRCADDLLEFAELRNAIVHERRGGEPIANPHASIVEEIAALSLSLENPPRVADMKRPPAVTCSPDETVGNAARKMLEGDFSQLPVYRDKTWVGLLTAETIARWLATKLANDVGLVEEESISEVLPFREGSSTEAFVARAASLVDVLAEFHSARHRGLDLDAVLVTNSGSRKEAPLMILTTFDLPEVYSLLDARRGGLG